MVFIASMALISGVGVRGATVPEIKYVQGGGRALIYVNNPEQITAADLGDSNYGDAAIMRATGVQGKQRCYFEHLNRTGFTIGYGIQLYNPNSTSVTVTVQGSGFEASVQGGRPFAQMLSNYSTSGTSYTVGPGRVLWLMRQDAAVANNTFFSGVIDFNVDGGSVTINHIAYRSFGALDGSTTYIGYVRRIEPDGTDEARVYKGLNPNTMAIAADVDFVVGDGDPAGVLAVSYRSYDLNSGAYGSSVIRPNGWYTNIGPANNANAVASDMFAFDMPGWGRIDPFSRSDGEGKYPNLGNWGVVYVVKGKVTNVGAKTRQLSVNLKANPSASAAIAYRGSDGVWRSMVVSAGSNVRYYSFSVAPGSTVSYEAMFVLGGPSGGNLLQSIALNN
ncbi:MAG: hypothetical protein C4334_01705 [Pyrinomonas sp.]